MRWIFRLFLFLIVLVLVAIGGLFLLPKDRLAAVAADQITQATGRQVTLNGDLSASFYPQLGVRTGAVEIASAEWATQGPLLTADGLSVGVDLAALLSGDIKVGQIEIIAPVVTLERDAEGRVSWEDGGGESATDQSSTTLSSARSFSLEALTLSNGTLRVEDRQAGISMALSDIDLTASLPLYDGPLRYELTALFNGMDVGSVGKIAEFGPFLAGNASGMELSAGVGNAVATFEGVADTSGALAGGLVADATDLEAVFGLLGQAAPDLPAEIRAALRAEGRLEAVYPLISLTSSTVTVGPNVMTGDVVVDLTAKTNIIGAFQTNTLDLSAFMAGENPAGSSGGASGSWSQSRIDASALSAMDATLSVTAQSVDLGTTQLGVSRFKAVLESSRLVLSSDQIQGFGGTVTGEFVVNNRNGLSVGGTLNARDVILQQMLGDLTDFERLEGQGVAQLRFLGSGASVDAIMKSLSGEAQMSVGQGALTGIDLVSLFRRGQGTSADATTIFDTLAASFTIQNGVLRNDDLAISANLFEAAGQGDIDLGNQTMDYQITPRVFEGESGGIAVPVRLKGPWSDLSIYPDLEAVAEQELAREREKLEQRLAEERARIEQEARQRATEEASQALGVDVQEGQSLGDAVEQKLEDELRKGLGGLFGGN